MPQIGVTSTTTKQVADLDGSNRSHLNSTTIDISSELGRRQEESDVLSSSEEDEGEYAASTSKAQRVQKLSQQRRLKLVSSQAFLFVASFLIL